jgi:hypothetical protein
MANGKLKGSASSLGCLRILPASSSLMEPLPDAIDGVSGCVFQVFVSVFCCKTGLEQDSYRKVQRSEGSFIRIKHCKYIPSLLKLFVKNDARSVLDIDLFGIDSRSLGPLAQRVTWMIKR